jgi:hypothetical protein
LTAVTRPVPLSSTVKRFGTTPWTSTAGRSAPKRGRSPVSTDTLTAGAGSTSDRCTDPSGNDQRTDQ